MKAQTKAAIASVAVIALALTAVSGVTYSWWTDSESTEVQITTGKFELGDATIETTYLRNGDATSVATTVGTGSGSSRAVSFEVAPPVSGDEHSRTYTLKYSTSYKSTAPATVKVTVTGSGTDDWIRDINVTQLSTGSGPSSATTYTPSNERSLDLDPSTTDAGIVAMIQFEVDMDKAVNKDSASLMIDAELTSRAAD